jgi:deoxyribodipyrimidine photo-lyase
MGAKILIYLLRRDLRLADNPVFHETCQAFAAKSGVQFTHLLPLYVFNATQIEISGFRNKDDNSAWPFPEARSRVGAFWRCGPHRAKFLTESVWDLKESLENIGSNLCIRAGQPAKIIEDALKHFQESKGKEDSAEIVGVWMTGEEAIEETSDEDKIRNVTEKADVEFRLFKDEKFYIDE